jgi:glutamine amidotransferase
VHSFYTQAENHRDILTTTNYQGIEFTSSILKDNVFATQFHPEKSGEKGLLIYKNWINKI